MKSFPSFRMLQNASQFCTKFHNVNSNVSQNKKNAIVLRHSAQTITLMSKKIFWWFMSKHSLEIYGGSFWYISASYSMLNITFSSISDFVTVLTFFMGKIGSFPLVVAAKYRLKKFLLKKFQEIEYIYLVHVCGIIYTVSQWISICISSQSVRYFRWDYIQKPPWDFKTLYCSWKIYSSDKHL